MVGCFVVFAILFTSCSKPTDEELFYEMQKTFSKIDSYSTIADITVCGNKSNKEYKVRHIFKKPNSYIIEVLEPEDSSGCITIYDGKQTWLYHPKIEQSILIKDIKNSIEENLFIGYFLGVLFTSEEVSIFSREIENNSFLVISTPIPGNNKYRYKQQLWINKKNFQPYKLEIFNKDGEISAEVIYSGFAANINIKDDDFNIKTIKDTIDKVRTYVKGEREREIIKGYKTCMGRGES